MFKVDTYFDLYGHIDFFKDLVLYYYLAYCRIYIDLFMVKMQTILCWTSTEKGLRYSTLSIIFCLFYLTVNLLDYITCLSSFIIEDSVSTLFFYVIGTYFVLKNAILFIGSH